MVLAGTSFYPRRLQKAMMFSWWTLHPSWTFDFDKVMRKCRKCPNHSSNISSLWLLRNTHAFQKSPVVPKKTPFSLHLDNPSLQNCFFVLFPKKLRDWFLTTLLFWDDPPSTPLKMKMSPGKLMVGSHTKVSAHKLAPFLGRHLLAPFMVRHSPCVRGVPRLAPWPILPSALLAAPAAPPLLGSWRPAPPPAPHPAPQRRRAARQRRRTRRRGVGLRQQGGLLTTVTLVENEHFEPEKWKFGRWLSFFTWVIC